VKTFHFLLLIIGMMVAVGVGWFIDNQPELDSENTLQVPDNIDYYLARINYRAYDAQGQTSYHLKSPYLEHYIREDRSQFTQPDLHYYKDATPWHITAEKGSLQHQTELFRLQEAVKMRRIDELAPLLLASELLEFDPSRDTITIPQYLTIDTDELELRADSAVMDMKNKRHQFDRVKAIYQRGEGNAPS
jgi:LPS export ABC transporter protein LptC